MNLDKYLRETHMLDYSNLSIQELIESRGWKEIEDFERIKSIYNFVRDEILFGYNIDDDISASKVLSDGYGQCNTKGTLFMLVICKMFVERKQTICRFLIHIRIQQVIKSTRKTYRFCGISCSGCQAG